MTELLLDAEALYLDLRRRVERLLQPGHGPGGRLERRRLAGRATGAATSTPGTAGVISSSLHRDDFGSRGMVHGSDPAPALRGRGPAHPA